MPVRVLSRYHLEELLAADGARGSHCISIGDPDESEPAGLRGGFRDVLRLEFHDIDSRKDMPASEGPLPPVRADIRKIVRFVRGAESAVSGYVIHCHAGVHRSTAAALIALYLMTSSEEGAKAELLKIKALPLPNRRMIELFDRDHGTDLGTVTAELWQRLKDFLAGKIAISPDDYLDELEAAEGGES